MPTQGSSSKSSDTPGDATPLKHQIFVSSELNLLSCQNERNVPKKSSQLEFKSSLLVVLGIPNLDRILVNFIKMFKLASILFPCCFVVLILTGFMAVSVDQMLIEKNRKLTVILVCLQTGAHNVRFRTSGWHDGEDTSRFPASYTSSRADIAT